MEFIWMSTKPIQKLNFLSWLFLFSGKVSLSCPTFSICCQDTESDRTGTGVVMGWLPGEGSILATGLWALCSLLLQAGWPAVCWSLPGHDLTTASEKLCHLSLLTRSSSSSEKIFPSLGLALVQTPAYIISSWQKRLGKVKDVIYPTPHFQREHFEKLFPPGA